jgi:hypothetical protein
VTVEPPEVPERGRRWARVLILAAGIVAAAAVGGYLWLSGDDSTGDTADSPPAETETVTVGIACPFLYEAFRHNQAGDNQALRQSVDEAAQAGEQALQQSGQEFGRPEEIAIELQHLLTQQPGPAGEEAERYLAEGREACDRLGDD